MAAHTAHIRRKEKQKSKLLEIAETHVIISWHSLRKNAALVV